MTFPSSRTLAPAGSDSTESTKSPEGAGPFRCGGVATTAEVTVAGRMEGATEAPGAGRTGSSGRIAT